MRPSPRWGTSFVILVLGLAACNGDESSVLPSCGDGIVQPGEECDDANGVNGDGCSVACFLEEGADADADSPGEADAVEGEDTEAGEAEGGAGDVPPGGACSCDSDCQTVEGQAGICVFGVCMTAASADCSAAGSTAECPAGSRCWGLSSTDGSICWPDCATYECAGTCDDDGSCAPASGMDCDNTCGSYCSEPPPPPPDLTDPPPPGPGPDCPDLPPLVCTGATGACSEILPFDPDEGPGYWDYPLNGETADNQYRSFLRRDVMMMIQYAAAKVACKSVGWPYGNGEPLGLGDMSEADGAIPGTSVGDPGHPAGTHTNGYDIDVAYFQVTTRDNQLRAVCPHTSVSGGEAYHCTGDPNNLDPWRSALFVGALAEHPNLRVIGADGRIGPMIDAATDRLCTDGWIDAAVCRSGTPLTWEATDTGRGWYLFHHHHMHVSSEHVAKSWGDVASPRWIPGEPRRPVKATSLPGIQP